MDGTPMTDYLKKTISFCASTTARNSKPEQKIFPIAILNIFDSPFIQIQSKFPGGGGCGNPLKNHISDVGEEDPYICDKLMIDLAKNDFPCSVKDKLSTKWRGKWYKATCIKCSVNPKGKKYIKVLFDEGGSYDYPERNWNASVRLCH